MPRTITVALVDIIGIRVRGGDAATEGPGHGNGNAATEGPRYGDGR